VANRKVSEFPAITGDAVDEEDLLTLVHVFEVDPVLRNKKITFTQFKEYLNQYYASTTGTTGLKLTNIPTHADNAAALTAGLVSGDVYKKADGTLMITY
jgi:hypothetical protein